MNRVKKLKQLLALTIGLTLLCCGCSTGAGQDLSVSEPAPVSLADTGGMVLEGWDLVTVSGEDILNVYLAGLADTCGRIFSEEYDGTGEARCMEGYMTAYQTREYDGAETSEMTVGNMEFYTFDGDVPAKRFWQYVCRCAEGSGSFDSLGDMYYPVIRDGWGDISTETAPDLIKTYYSSLAQRDDIVASVSGWISREDLKALDVSEDARTGTPGGESLASDTAWRNLLAHLVQECAEDCNDEAFTWKGDIYLMSMTADGKTQTAEYWVCRDGEAPRRLQGDNSQAWKGFALTYRYEDVTGAENFTDGMKAEACSHYRVELEFALTGAQAAAGVKLEPIVTVSEIVANEKGDITVSAENVVNAALNQLVGSLDKFLVGGEAGEQMLAVEGCVADSRGDRTSEFSDDVPYSLMLIAVDGSGARTDYFTEIDRKEDQLLYDDLYDFFVFTDSEGAEAVDGYVAAEMKAELQVKTAGPQAELNGADLDRIYALQSYLGEYAWRDVLMQMFSEYRAGSKETSGKWSAEIYLLSAPDLLGDGSCEFAVRDEAGNLIKLVGDYESWRGRYTYTVVEDDALSEQTLKNALVQCEIDLSYTVTE